MHKKNAGHSIDPLFQTEKSPLERNSQTGYGLSETNVRTILGRREVKGMGTPRQSKIFEAMQRPDFYPHPVTAVDEQETHISKVFLTGHYVYKVKKPVNLGFLDFTTLRKRKHFCEQEVILNRRLTQDVYLDVVAITHKDGQYHLAGPGIPVEYAVKMRQLPEESSMFTLLQEGKLDVHVLEDLAQALAAFYKRASTGGSISSFGSQEIVRHNCEENFTQTEPFVGTILDEQQFRLVRDATRSFLDRTGRIFQHRIASGKIRDCHGDLRTGHIYFTDRVQIIDCIEFNERFRYGDVASDLAFLAMDLDFSGYPEVASDLLNAYVHYTDDQDVFTVLDFYKCYRAVVRAKVNCFRLEQGGLNNKEKETLLNETHRYMELACRYATRFCRKAVWVVCGMPASGKSSIAAKLARTLGVKVFNSDIVRKQLFGLQPGDQMDVPFEEGIYSKEATSLTYEKLLMLAHEEIKQGHSVILDATYSRQQHRREVIRFAKDMDVNVIFVECKCPEAELKKRLLERKSGSAVSDARIHHFRQLKLRFEPLNEVGSEMHICVNTEKSLGENLQQVLCRGYILECRQTDRIIQKIPQYMSESGES